MLKRLTTFLSVSFILFINGCCSIKSDKQLTPFPPRPQLKEYQGQPVISHNKTNNTYIISGELLYNATMHKIFIDEIIKWKTYNGIE